MGLAFLTALCPSARYYEKRGRQGQTLNERSWRLIQLVARWLPDRTLVFVADSSFAAIKFLQLVSKLPNIKQKVPYIIRRHQPGDMGWVTRRHDVIYNNAKTKNTRIL